MLELGEKERERVGKREREREQKGEMAQGVGGGCWVHVGVGGCTVLCVDTVRLMASTEQAGTIPATWRRRRRGKVRLEFGRGKCEQVQGKYERRRARPASRKAARRAAAQAQARKTARGMMEAERFQDEGPTRDGSGRLRRVAATTKGDSPSAPWPRKLVRTSQHGNGLGLAVAVQWP